MCVEMGLRMLGGRGREGDHSERREEGVIGCVCVSVCV